MQFVRSGIAFKFHQSLEREYFFMYDGASRLESSFESLIASPAFIFRGMTPAQVGKE
jgi:hypothetical protein